MTPNNQRVQLLQNAIDQIQGQPWQRLYRGRLVGQVVNGWNHRLLNYGLITTQNPSLLAHLEWLNSLHAAVDAFVPNDFTTLQAGMILGNQILSWGGVTRNNAVKLSEALGPVVQSAREGMLIGGAPMNSGWTKIAAIFSYFNPKSPSQVIWDSRVSLAICHRLANASIHYKLTPQQLRGIFPNLGWIPGRGGNRPKLIEKVTPYFPNKYRCWKAHFAGGQIASEIANLLNQARYSPISVFTKQQLAELNIAEKNALKKWNPWLVGCVLFMDGQ